MEANRLASRYSSRMFPRLLNFMVIVMVVLTTGSCRKQAPAAPRVLKAGDSLNGMLLTTGVSHAPPLEVFCEFEEDEELSDINCQVPPLEKLAIGHLVGATGRALQELDWSKLDWQVYLDGYRLDLDTFGEYSTAEPVVLSAPSPIREAVQQRKTWDVVLVNPTFGLHTLDCMVKANSLVYSWVVNFMINPSRGPINMVESTPVQISAGLDLVAANQ